MCGLSNFSISSSPVYIQFVLYGYNTANTTDTISLYADDILLYIHNHQLLCLLLEKIIYLGIVVTKNDSSPVKDHFLPLLEKLKNNIQFWRTLPISLTGRVISIKMVFLLQLLYLSFYPNPFSKTLMGILCTLYGITAFLPKGLQMERDDCLPFSICAIILSPIPLTGAPYNHNPIVHNTIRIWEQKNKQFRLKTLSLVYLFHIIPHLPRCLFVFVFL